MNYGDYIDFKDVKKILVIKLRHLGDVLLSTPVFYNLKNQIKDSKVDAFIYEDAKEILQNNPYINEVISYSRDIKKLSFLKRIKKEIEILKTVRKKKYDLIINLTEGDRGAIICLFSKAKYRVGIKEDKKGLFKKQKIYTHIAKLTKTKRHTVEKNLDVLRRIGIFPNKDSKKLHFEISNNAKEKTSKILNENNIKINDYILIHPTTRWRFKCFDKFDQLAKYFHQNNQKMIIVSGKQDYEMEMANQITQNLPILNLAGKVNIDELAALILFSKRFYCLDSLSFHLANSIKANVTAFFGPTCEKTWGPWQNENAKIITYDISCRPCSMDGCGSSKVSECLKSIELEDVIKKI
ncbi:MAG: Lipopolysaccharide core heptosyltransferase RfaQ [Candidatus Anoxychlamydiales bacterium]|nr:Lipopolysaccharide core heptosyltransferase RfaQ [Candidatus Anoxychlamydiales bacterium]